MFSFFVISWHLSSCVQCRGNQGCQDIFQCSQDPFKAFICRYLYLLQRLTWHGMRGWSREHESYTDLTLFSEKLQKNNDLVQTRLFRLHTAGGKTQNRCLGKNIEGGSLHPNRKVRPDVYDRDVSTNIGWWRWHAALSGTPGWDVQAEDSLLLCSKGAAAALYPLETIRGMTDPCSCVLLPTDCKTKSAREAVQAYPWSAISSLHENGHFIVLLSSGVVQNTLIQHSH